MIRYLSGLLTLYLLLFTAIQTRAQTEKGRWTLGAQVGTLSYQNTYQTPSGSKSFAANLTPLAGYFVANGLAIGAGVPLTLNTTTYNDVNYVNLRNTTTGVGLAPFIRYYVGSSKLKPFIGVSYSYSRTVSKYKTDTAGGAQSKATGYTSSFVPTLGIAYFINRSLAPTFSVNYNVNHQELNTVETSPYTPGASFSNSSSKILSLGLGFQLFAGK